MTPRKTSPSGRGRAVRWSALAAIAVAAAILAAPADAHAYVGPGAGIAFATTVLALVVSVVVVIFGLLLWPLRYALRLITRKRPPQPPRIRRAVVIGLDGLDPQLVRRFMAEGRLPNLVRLAERGGFRELGTTYPAMSPVAWSSFATGVDPAKHGIFDFLTRDPKSYQPDLSSADIRPPVRNLNLGGWRIPIGKPRASLLRKSRAFWEVLGRYQVPCSILRVPITFPAQPFEGTLLSAMCVPDLQGSQGTFSYFTSGVDRGEAIGGQRVAVTVDGDRVTSELAGPPNPIRKEGEPLRLPFTVHIDRGSGRGTGRGTGRGGKGTEGGEGNRRRVVTATLHIGRERVALPVGEYTDWIPVAFPLGLGLKLRGICRFRLLALEPEFRLYVTPINIDPENPILPISHPRVFSVFLSKLIGRYATLGLAEDTWALNEGVLDEDAFLEQAWANHDEREAMFFEMLRRTPRGLVTCVFDGTDRIQHMFMRYLDDGHPALAGAAPDAGYAKVIPDTYARMDEMVGRVLDKVDMNDPENLVAVISDHGFQTFRRGININSWLLQNGYLALEEGETGSGEWFRGVDWSRTRAFAVGLGGIFLNIRGREAQGIVEPDQARALADEIAARLTGLRDPDVPAGSAGGEIGGSGSHGANGSNGANGSHGANGANGSDSDDRAVAIRTVYPAHTLYKGPYAEDAPDLIVGYSAGWRASWDGVRGIVTDTVFDDNTKAWSGDHCIDPELVPGVLIANQRFGDDERRPAISDLAPTLLDLFGVPAPRYMDGRSLVRAAS